MLAYNPDNPLFKPYIDKIKFLSPMGLELKDPNPYNLC